MTEGKPTRGPAPSHSPPDTYYAPGGTLARGLAWFSIGLGLAEMFAPDAVADLSGVHRPGLIRGYGLRELACGIGILYSNRPTAWMWGRVAGDVLDLATVAGADDAGRGQVAALALLGVTALDVISALELSAAASLEG
jgi:hypothetical protein